MDPVRLKALVALAETGSIAKAARREGVRRASLARRLDELSDELGAPVATTSRTGSVLTEEGARLAAEAPELIRRADRLWSQYGAVEVAPGTFRFVAPAGLAPPVTSLLMAAASRALPEVRVEVTVHAEPLDLVGGVADLALVFGPDVPEGPWKVTSVGRLVEGLWAAPRYLAKRGTPRSLEELEEHRLLLWQRPGMPRNALPLHAGGLHPVVPWLSSNDAWLLQRGAERGVGIACIPSGPMPRRPEVTEPLVPVLKDVVRRPCTLNVVMTAQSVPRLRWRTMNEAIRAVFKAL